MSNSTVAIVILNFNGKKHLETFLPSVLHTTYEQVKIVVADNGSTDDSLSFLKENHPNITCLQRDTNEGFAGGYNWALSLVDADYYVLLNSDVKVQPNWLEPMVSLLDSNTNIAACQPKILSYANPSCFEYAGASGGWIDALGYPFSRGRIFDVCENDNGQYNHVSPIFWATGASLFIRSTCYKEMGGLDESFFAHQEEIDLCWRTINKGYSIKYNSASVVYHVGGATLQQGNPKKTFLNFRNSLLMLTKNLPQKEIYSILFQRMILDGIAAIQFLLKGKVNHFLAVLKAHASFYSLFSTHYKKREVFQVNKYYTVKSIVYIYFLKNVTIFKDILTFK